jgi:AGZA family xanthine/uracil permease-like MFS transporter
MLARLFSFLPPEEINLKREIMGGVINFMAIAYIIAVNPLILHAGGSGFPINPAITATVLLIVVMTAIASLLIKLPFVLAPGMGVNAIVTYNLVIHDHLPLNTVLGVIFFSSLLLLIFSVSRIRQVIVHAIPEFLQIALSAGIGFFLFLIGAKNVGIIIANPNTIVSLGQVSLANCLAFGGFIVATVLFIRGKAYAFLLPLVGITIINALLNPHIIPESFIASPDFSLVAKLDLLSTLKLSILPAIISLFIVNFFDATSATMGLLAQMQFKSTTDKNRYLKRALLTDSIGGVMASTLGSAPSVIFIESSAAIHNGAKTGIASLVTALICIPFIFCSPLISIIPAAATAPILMLVGLIMLSNISHIKLTNFEDIVAVIITIIMMPLCFSITAGAVFGIVSYTCCKLLLGKYHELSVPMVIIALASLGWLYLH